MDHAVRLSLVGHLP